MVFQHTTSTIQLARDATLVVCNLGMDTGKSEKDKMQLPNPGLQREKDTVATWVNTTTTLIVSCSSLPGLRRPRPGRGLNKVRAPVLILLPFIHHCLSQ